ncbi:hypothetical protein QJS04_geneDACA006200 [Acorus gramineus]|uniref:Uncharacterized protein n=1 Tax=Acorus gramineus TaxID=55184 RepID=A0AAV9AWA3_ACOGR|nr:hypothetical protein QJS04_geneDACA006200 [Acorus gramineus]
MINGGMCIGFKGEYGQGFVICIGIVEVYVLDSCGGMSPMHVGVCVGFIEE